MFVVSDGVCDKCASLLAGNRGNDVQRFSAFSASACNDVLAADLPVCCLCDDRGATHVADGLQLCQECFDYQGKLLIGDAVEVHGLQGSAFLNGRRGHIVDFVADAQRVAVLLTGASAPMAVRTVNLRKVSDTVNLGSNDDDLVCCLCNGPCNYEDRQVCKACGI